MQKKWTWLPLFKRIRRSDEDDPGQSMVEYALILVLVALALVAAVTLTGPAVGNIFSNQVYNLLGQTVTPYNTYSVNNIVATYGTAVASFTYVKYAFQTNTPLGPTCVSPHNGQWQTSTPGTYVPC